MWMEKFALICLVLFGLIGAGALAIILHEYSHYNDFKNFNTTDNYICGLNLPTKWVNWSYFENGAAGYYYFTAWVNTSNSTEVTKFENVQKNTETKAYIVSVLVFIFFLTCYYLITDARHKDRMRLIEKGMENLEKDIYIQKLERYILNNKFYKDANP